MREGIGNYIFSFEWTIIYIIQCLYMLSNI